MAARTPQHSPTPPAGPLLRSMKWTTCSVGLVEVSLCWFVAYAGWDAWKTGHGFHGIATAAVMASLAAWTFPTVTWWAARNLVLGEPRPLDVERLDANDAPTDT